MREDKVNYVMKNLQYNKELKPLAHNLRHTMTKAEACLWKHVLRAGMMCGYSFRRQRPISIYIVDCVCPELQLVIEVDGGSHLFEEIQIKDLEKERDLNNLEFTVLRFTDEKILREIEEVKFTIERAVSLLEERILPLPSQESV
jgi:very-short-patch-repair endonuclease